MSIEKVRKFFAARGMEDRVREFDVSSATVELAAQALNCEPQRIAKTLAFIVQGKPTLIVAAGDAKIDNPKYKAQFAEKATMVKVPELEEKVGYPIGGVCPFDNPPGVEVYLDESLKRFETVYPACGSSNSAIELTLPELEDCSGYRAWIDVTKGWQ